MNFRPAASWAGLAALTTVTLLAHTGIPAMATAEGGSVTGQVVWCAAIPVPLGIGIPGTAAGGSGPTVPQPGPLLPTPPGISILPQGPNPDLSAPDQQGPSTGIAV